MWSLLMMFFFNLFLKNFFVCFSFSVLFFLIILDFSWPNIFGYFFFLDQMKFLLILLTMSIFLFLAFENLLKKWLFFNLSLLKFSLIFCFLLNEFILFYFFFELALIPTAYLIFSWGIQPERVSASFYFLLYALMGSFPLLANLIYLSNFLGEFNFSLKFKKNNYYFLIFKNKNLVTTFWMFSFLIKLPLYGLHLWLPKAHVEAPVFGSMILAAVLLKLGGYGLLRLSTFKIMKKFNLLFWVMMTLSVMGLISFRKIDMKALIAYSSISHMALTLILYYFFNFKSFVGMMLILMGHGFMSSSLFQSFNSLYLHSESRKIFLKKAIKKFSGLFYFFFFFILCLNSSLPLNLTFFSEMIVGMTLFYLKKSFVFFFVISVFLIGLYKMNLFLFTNQGLKISSLKKIYFKSFSFFVSFLHIFFNFFLVFFFWKFS